MEKKNLRINCATCDMRNLTEEVANSYGTIWVNAAAVLTNPKVNALLSKADIKINTANMISVSDNVKNRSINGKFEVRNPTEFQEPTVLTVNGSLRIYPEAQEGFHNVENLVVNGTLIYPDNMKGKLPPMMVNGTTKVYPADAILLDNKVVVDKVFLLRAKESKYYVKNQVLILDSKLNLASLVEKGVLFLTKKAFVAASLLETAVQLFEEDTEIIEVPNDCAYIDDDVELDLGVFHKYGTRLLIDGSLLINEDGAEILQKMQYLNVNGDLYIYEECLEQLNKVEHCEDKLILRSSKIKYIVNLANVTVTKSFLESTVQNIEIRDCARVKIASDIPVDLLQEKLHIADCAFVECSSEQKPILQIISEDCARIDDEIKLEENSTEDTIRINTAEYAF